MNTSLATAAKGLNVIRLPKRPDNLSSIKSEIGAKYLIDGNLVQAGDKFRLVISLNNTDDNSTVWSKTYNKKMSIEDIFETQDEIVNNVVKEIIGSRSGTSSAIRRDIAKKVKSRGTKMSSYECVNYVRATYFQSYSNKDFVESMRCLKESVATDSNYTDAWIELAAVQSWGYTFKQVEGPDILNEAMQNIDKAIFMDPSNPFAYTIKANILYFQKNWDQMYKTLENALELAPNNVAVLTGLGYMNFWGGDCKLADYNDFNAKPGTYSSGKCRWQEGKKFIQKADELDRANIEGVKIYVFAWIHSFRGEYEEVIKRLQSSPAPQFPWWHFHMGYAQEQLGNLSKAAEHFEKVKKLLNTTLIKDVENYYDFWNCTIPFLLHKPLFKKYGFV